MKRFLKWLSLALLLVVVAVALTAVWLLRWDELPPPEMPGVVESGVLEHDGRERKWLAYVPASKKENTALLLVLHGSQSDGAMGRTGTFYSFDVLAEREGIVVVYPSGVEKHWNDCRAGANYAANQQSVDDVGFLRALVTRMSERYGVDSRRVFAAGVSNGGQMVYRLGMEAPDLLAGGAAFIANLPVETNLDCIQQGQPVPMLVISGTEDPINPYGGGLVDLFGDTSRGLVLSAQDTARYWAALAGYRGQAKTQQLPEQAPDDDTSLQSALWSAPGRAPVQLISVVGGGHTFPHPVYAAPRILGITSHEADGAELVWGFFSELP